MKIMRFYKVYYEYSRKIYILCTLPFYFCCLCGLRDRRTKLGGTSFILIHGRVLEVLEWRVHNRMKEIIRARNERMG